MTGVEYFEGWFDGQCGICGAWAGQDCITECDSDEPTDVDDVSMLAVYRYIRGEIVR